MHFPVVVLNANPQRYHRPNIGNQPCLGGVKHGHFPGLQPNLRPDVAAASLKITTIYG